MGQDVLRCRACGKMFVFTAGEARFYARKGLSTPCRCKDCRRERRENPDPYEGWESTMGGYRPVKRGHKRVQYSGLILAGGMSQ